MIDSELSGEVGARFAVRYGETDAIIVAPLHGYAGVLLEGNAQDERAGEVGKSAHDVEATGCGADESGRATGELFRESCGEG